MDDRSMVIADPEEVRKAKSKRAWVCGHCNHTNDADDTSCDSCGNPRSTESGDKRVVSRRYGPDGAPRSQEEVPEVAYEGVDGQSSRPIESVRNMQEEERRLWEAEQAKKKARRKRSIRILVGIGLGIAAIIWIFSLKKEVDFKVSGFAWEREVRIEKFGPHDYSSWDYPPAGAYSISSQREVHHYDRIYEGRECHTESRSYVCGQIDNGNGTFSDQYCTENVEVCEDKYREEPVYATKYYYTIDEWGYSHKETAKAENKDPHWPRDPRTQSQPSVWREGGKTGRYYLDVQRKENSPHRDEVSLQVWQKTEAGDVVKGYIHPWFGYFKGLRKDESPS
jgi:hypothetical protein